MSHFGYWVFGKNMNDVNIEKLKSNGVTDIFLNYYAFTTHGESKVKSWIQKVNSNNVNVHIWVQCFYNGEWINPVNAKTHIKSKIEEIKKYASITGVKGIHLDYLRYPGNAYKTTGGPEAITNFVKDVRSQIPNMVLSCAVMPESSAKYYYGQDFDALGKVVDYILPMQYKGNYGGGTDWLKSTTKMLVSKGKIWSGLQSYKSDDDTSLLSSKELLNDAKVCLDNGADGVILFRYGLSNDVNFNELLPKSSEKMDSYYTFEETVKIANNIKTNVEKQYQIGENAQWSYFIARQIVAPKKNVDKWYIKPAQASTGDSIDIKIYKNDYMDMANRLVKYCDTNKQLPNYITYSGKKVKVNDYVYMFARILAYYDKNKAYPNYATVNSKSFTKTSTTTTTSTNSNCTNPYVSSPHYTSQGVGYLGQATPYYCGPNSLHQCLRKFGITDISQTTLAQVAGTTTSGTGHSGLDTAVAWVAKKKGIKLTTEWRNFSSFGSNDTARFKAIGEIACKPNKAIFFHIGYEDSGSARGSSVFGHYEMCDKYNISTKYVRALNSLGSRSGNGYYGHLQDRTFSLQAHYISNISQKSVCIITKG